MNDLSSDSFRPAWWRLYASINWVIIGLGNGLLGIQQQAIAWINTGAFFDMKMVSSRYSESHEKAKYGGETIWSI